MKTCNKCKKEKPYTEFGKNRARIDGYRYECKECRNASLRTGKPNEGRFKKGEQRYPENCFKKGIIPWNKDKKGCMPPVWNKGFRKSEKKKHHKYYDWANAVKDRDNWTCQECGKKEGLITAHHIIPWKKDKGKRFDLDNGKTLCQSCHSRLEGFQKGHKNMRKTTKGLFKKGQKALNPFPKGHVPWNKKDK